jgi:hypothetical protein
MNRLRVLCQTTPAARIRLSNIQSSGGDLPVAFAENEIGVTFVPFATGFDIGIRVHETHPFCGLPEKLPGTLAAF